MWVAASENVRVIGNELFDSVIGLEISVSNNVLVKQNEIHSNTVGVGLFHPNAAGNAQLPVMENWVIEHNNIYDNNRVERSRLRRASRPGLPPGVGVLLLGVSDHVIAKNTVEDNDFVGIAVLGWCTATATNPARNCVVDPPQADPAANNNLVSQNKVRRQRFESAGRSASRRGPLYSSSSRSSGNCFAKNSHTFSARVAADARFGQLPRGGSKP